MLNLRGHLAGLLDGAIGLGKYHRWSWDNVTAIEEHRSDEDVALLSLERNRFAEYTSGSIDAARLLDALRTDHLVRDALARDRMAVA